MRILVIGDQHFRFELPYASAFDDGRKGEWEATKNTIHDTAKTCDAVVLLGDNLNQRHNHSSVIREFVDYLNEFGDKEVHILVGNHEKYGTSTALDFLKAMKKPNWHVHTEPRAVEVAGQFAMMIPFMTPALLGVETKEEGLAAIIEKFPKDGMFPLAFAHHGISGSKVHGNIVDLFNEIVLPMEVMEQKFHRTFAGHIHEKSVLSERVVMTGNIFTNEMGEHEKSIWVYEKKEVEDNSADEPKYVYTTEQIPLPVRGIYKLQLDSATLPDLLKIPANSIVKCIVTCRDIQLETVRKMLERFDASVIVEQYPNEREKVHFEDGFIDTSVDGLLKMYAKAKGLEYTDLQEGFALINKI